MIFPVLKSVGNSRVRNAKGLKWNSNEGGVFYNERRLVHIVNFEWKFFPTGSVQFKGLYTFFLK